MVKIPIEIKHSPYEVIVGDNTFQKLYRQIKSKNLYQNIFCIVDRNIYSLYKDLMIKLKTQYNKLTIYTLIAIEQNKQLKSAEKIYSRMLNAKFGRDTTIVAIGGGLIGDIAGFVATTYMRGVNLVHIPTTILAAVDSSIGGKTGVNFKETKNIIGTFYQPNLVLIDTRFFNTLPKEEVISGLGEITKYAFITHHKYNNYFTRNLSKIIKLDSTIIQKIIVESVKFKGSVVTFDEKESGIRKILNFGHTFGHGIEVEQNYQLKHGATIIVGISCALFLSRKSNLISDEQFNNYISICKTFQKHIKIKRHNASIIYKIMQRDKKNRKGKIQLVLIHDIGKLVLDINHSRKDILSAIEYGITLFK
jgi:3-dehydroquinate synthase